MCDNSEFACALRGDTEEMGKGLFSASKILLAAVAAAAVIAGAVMVKHHRQPNQQA